MSQNLYQANQYCNHQRRTDNDFASFGHIQDNLFRNLTIRRITVWAL